MNKHELLAYAMVEEGLILCEKNKGFAGIHPTDLVAALESSDCLGFLEEKGIQNILSDCDDVGGCDMVAGAQRGLWLGLLGLGVVQIRYSRHRMCRGQSEPA